MHLVFVWVGHNAFGICLGRSQSIWYLFGSVTKHLVFVWVGHNAFGICLGRT